ncbi:unnamed protein product [Victoria cruziana]
MIKLHGEEEVVEEASSEPRNLHFEFRGTGSAQSALPGEREKQKVLGVNLVWHARQLLIKGANAALAPSVLLPSLVAELRSPLSWGLHLAKTNRCYALKVGKKGGTQQESRSELPYMNTIAGNNVRTHSWYFQDGT